MGSEHVATPARPSFISNGYIPSISVTEPKLPQVPLRMEERFKVHLGAPAPSDNDDDQHVLRTHYVPALLCAKPFVCFISTNLHKPVAQVQYCSHSADAETEA